MYNLLSGLKVYFKSQEITIDGPIFRIHCIFTSVLLFAFSTITTWYQFIGQPIQCIVDRVPTHVINTYCWIMSTFTMPSNKIINL
jgi:Na+/alanine symporter